MVDGRWNRIKWAMGWWVGMGCVVMSCDEKGWEGARGGDAIWWRCRCGLPLDWIGLNWVG